MNTADKRLLNRLQEGLPLVSEPYRAIGDELGMAETVVLSSIERLQAEGYIRRIGGIFDSGSLGFKSTLCALKMQEEEALAAAEYISSLSGVTHNYIRRHAISLWFTVTAPSEADLKATLAAIRAHVGANRLITFPSLRRFKIKAVFRLEDPADA